MDDTGFQNRQRRCQILKMSFFSGPAVSHSQKGHFQDLTLQLRRRRDESTEGKGRHRPGRRPDGGDQPEPGGRGDRDAQVPGNHPRLGRGARRPRHRRGEVRRPERGHHPQPRTGGRHAVVRPGVHARQARLDVLRAGSSTSSRSTTSATSSTSAATTRPTPSASSTRTRPTRGTTCASIHIPKTIDNDLPITDHCPGYGSAALFVSSAFIGD